MSETSTTWRFSLGNPGNTARFESYESFIQTSWLNSSSPSGVTFARELDGDRTMLSSFEVASFSQDRDA